MDVSVHTINAFSMFGSDLLFRRSLRKLTVMHQIVSSGGS